jgi:hypothetical protein
MSERHPDGVDWGDDHDEDLTSEDEQDRIVRYFEALRSLRDE